MADLIKEKYDLAPSDSGVYMMKDIRGKIIYVGKAKNLKKRLASYFARESGHDPKTTLLVRNIVDFDLIITATEHEALILEATLIKRHKPKYNVFLKDGKNYPCFRIDTLQSYPVLQVVRKIKNDKATYFGPYPSGYSVKKTLKQVNRIFKLRKCKDSQFKNRSRPCIQFQIKACLGPCCNDLPLDVYHKIVSDVTLFLKGRAPDLIKQLKQEMVDHAEHEQFEKAAEIRDTIFAIERSLEQQIVVATDMMDRDVVACVDDRGRAVVTLVFVRAGYVVGTEHYSFDMNWNGNAQIMEAFLKQYYQSGMEQNCNLESSQHYQTKFIPQQILVAEDFEDRKILEETLSMIKGYKVSILVPERGEKRRIVEMALNNAQKELAASIARNSENEETLRILQKLVRMENVPRRIECFDNSNIAGTDPVSSMVVFINGEPDKSRYRKFIINNVTEHDDYAYMTEVLTRRFSSSRSDKNRDNAGKNSEDKYSAFSDAMRVEQPDISQIDLPVKRKTELPDLLVVDGGKGQLSMAVAVLAELGLTDQIKVIGLAKKDSDRGETHDKIYVPGRANPLNTDKSIKALYLLQRLRDEAHRFAITFQKKRRSIRAETSLLDTVSGIGKKRKALLLNHFKGISAMKKATVEELAVFPGISRNVAKNLFNVLKES
ncbi:MAG: excinuclease ABC subunit UvrC [Desulfamplus sp.]|nr:excinuclease ABC subunit UvrC [Desulfamplus sp.]